jgi:ligand-binding SRPBCC domain-containing protein
LVVKHHLEQEQLVRRNRREVFAFFADAANLERITPDSLHFEIRSVQPIAMRAGATIHYQLSPGGTLVRDHVEYEVPLGPLGELANRLFVARQLRRIFDFRRTAIEAAFG